MKTALRQALPALLCFFPLGIVYGLLFTQAGYAWYYAPIFSLFVYGGAMQFLALTILTAGGSLITLALSLIPLGLRNIFYGMTQTERYKKCHPLLRAYLAHTLVDGTYSILLTGPRFEGKKDVRYLTQLSIILHLSWVSGTLLGTFADRLFVLPSGLEFSLTAFFAASSVEQLRKTRDVKPLLISAAAIAFALLLMPHHLFLGGVVIATAAVLLLPQGERRVA